MRRYRLRVRRFTTLLVAVLTAALVGCGGGASTTSTQQPAGSPSSPPGPAQNPDTGSPSIAITAPATTGSYTTTANSLTFSGTASDNVGVVAVTWRNNATGANGTASGTSTWSVANAPLVVGANLIVVSARDAAGNVGTVSLSVALSASGPASLSGRIDSSLINRSGSNAVYLYLGSVTPDDVGGASAQPLVIAPVTQDSGACT